MILLFGFLIVSIFLVLKSVPKKESFLKKERLLLIKSDKIHDKKTLVVLNVFAYIIILLVVIASLRFVFIRFLRCSPHTYYDKNVEVILGDGCVLDEDYANR
jgi:hypothetical protein